MKECPYMCSPFCRGLSAEDKAALCPPCRVFYFKRKADAQENSRAITRQVDKGRPVCTVLLDGMYCTNRSQNSDTPKAFLLWQAGDIINPESMFGRHDELQAYYYRYYITDGAFALIPFSAMRERFVQNPAFSMHLFASVSNTRVRQTAFLLGTQLQDARSALMYLLLFCQEHKLPALTHQDFAYLTGLNRTTVTKTLKKILANEDLSIPLKDYIRSTYEEGR